MQNICAIIVNEIIQGETLITSASLLNVSNRYFRNNKSFNYQDLYIFKTRGNRESCGRMKVHNIFVCKYANHMRGV